AICATVHTVDRRTPRDLAGNRTGDAAALTPNSSLAIPGYRLLLVRLSGFSFPRSQAWRHCDLQCVVAGRATDDSEEHPAVEQARRRFLRHPHVSPDILPQAVVRKPTQRCFARLSEGRQGRGSKELVRPVAGPGSGYRYERRDRSADRAAPFHPAAAQW